MSRCYHQVWGCLFFLLAIVHTQEILGGEYTTEFVSRYSDIQFGDDQATDINVSTSIHLDVVKDEFHPKAEATFLERMTNLTFNGNLYKEQGQKTRSVGLSGELMGKKTDGYLSFTYLDESTSTTNAEYRKVGLGWFWESQSLVKMIVGLEDIDRQGSAIATGIEGKWIYKFLFNRTLQFDLLFENTRYQPDDVQMNHDKSTAVKMDGHYFFNQFTSFGFSMSTIKKTGDIPNLQSIHMGRLIGKGRQSAYRLTLRHFLSDTFGLQVQWTDIQDTRNFQNGDVGSVAVITRF